MIRALAIPDATAAASTAPVNLAVTMLVIFGSAKLLAELFERMKQPGIAGEILAGVIIGPSLLGWISPGEFTITMAELGVMFLLFRVGLEVEPAGLMKVGGTAVAVGVLGVIVPFASSFLLVHFLGHPKLESIFVGTALTATSVGIAECRRRILARGRTCVRMDGGGKGGRRPGVSSPGEGFHSGR